MTKTTATKAEPQTVGELVDSLPPVRAITPAAPVESTIFQIIERAARDPNVDIDKMERLILMQERVQSRQAEIEFDNAMSSAQEAMKAVRSDSPNNQTKSKYASYAALDAAIRPIYAEHGFSLSFDTAESATPDNVRVICKVAHRGGHRERPHIDMPCDGKGAKGGDVMTRTHAMGSAVSYAKRYLLSMIFNVATTNDDDGNAAGGRGMAGGGTQFRPERRQQQDAFTPDALSRVDPDDQHLVQGDGRSNYAANKLKAARAGGWVVVNKTAKGQRDQITDYLNMAETPEDVAAILNHNAQLIANSGDREVIEEDADKLLRYWESQAKGGAA